ncbi:MULTISPECIES: RagB/SusD family nutrient uptake outer membrane protein [Butyricimonas]|uniref:RagB/SusD family nutrient uptake outer membrane protein n=1 Tax=Butyricimonas TaxID=574697 RepID=UPI001D08687A|nr:MULTISPECIES: RagB/SusD family nutrient uptake outer membrane protein [Butyricimonas]MCB6972719.1 RagB/SusD family nutrient uptake outer membrane protein [Butyricimonas synergistica]MCG4519727.1 RagB/SusD family nutrient uptake outer membrane protein [Butyricimonas sp. DFI.6.44]
MKKILILFLFIPLFSCNDWLTVEPEDSVTFVNYFKSESELEALYNMVQSRMKYVCFGRQPYFYSSIDADDVQSDVDGYRKLDVLKYTGTSNTQSWTAFYNVIYLTNVMIENQHRFENVSKERADFWLGQIHFAKALAYFRVAQIWGDAPITPSSESIDPIGKSPALEVLQEALKEAKAALVLPTHDKLLGATGAAITTKQCASLGTVNTLLANICAWMGGLTGERKYWEDAERYASEVLDGKAGVYDLESMNGLIENVLGKNRNSEEVIYAISNNALDYDRNYESFQKEAPGHFLISYPYLTEDKSEIANLVNNSKNAYTRIKVTTVKEIYPEENDLRRKEFWYKLGELKYYSKSESESESESETDLESKEDSLYSPYAHIAKWRYMVRQMKEDIAGMPAILTDCDWVFWRLADLILLRAECRVQLDMTEEAVSDLDRVRERAGLAGYAGSTSKEALREEVFLERRRELFGEGQYYFDIVRNGYFRKYLLGGYRTLTNEDVKNGALYTKVHSNAFRKNTLMTQNTYWQWQE